MKNLTILHDASNKTSFTQVKRTTESNAISVIEALKNIEWTREELEIYRNKLLPGSDDVFESFAENLSILTNGHHPAEMATLQMAKELSNDVVLVYRHQNVRRTVIISGQYTNDIFRDANEIYWLPTYLTRGGKPDLPNFNTTTTCQKYRQRKVHFCHQDDSLWQEVTAASEPGKSLSCKVAGTPTGGFATIIQKLAIIAAANLPPDSGD